MLRIGIVAGEASGDMLGAGLMGALKMLEPELEITGIGGRLLRKAGCTSLYPMERLSVMGVSEVFSRYFELFNTRRALIRYFLENPPDVFIGVDSPDFNLPLERALRKSGIRTIHYVSPSIWAWREYRLGTIAKSADLVLTLFPFEPPYYEKYKIPVLYVGHPLARRIGPQTDRVAACRRLNLTPDDRLVALMPGSRRDELSRLVGPFLRTAKWCRERDGHLRFATSLVDESSREHFLALAHETGLELPLSVFIGKSLEVMAAADVVLLASGTAALEALLLKRPMVVAYKVSGLTYAVARWLVNIPWVSLPNVLAGRRVVPEFLQRDCRPEILGPAVLRWLSDGQAVRDLELEFTRIHALLQPPPAETVARAVLNVIHASS